MPVKSQKDAPAAEKMPGPPTETAAYIFDMLAGLSSIARKSDLIFLAYLIEMAASEAARISEDGEKGGASHRGQGS